MKVCEIYDSIQGEGRFQGHPATFVRLSGCNRNCKFCDTKYHKEHFDVSPSDLVNLLSHHSPDIVVWTGGEPLLQLEEMATAILGSPFKLHHLESNGDLVRSVDDLQRLMCLFSYICFSPKDEKVAKRLHSLIKFFASDVDIKVVTDLEKVGVKLLPYATMIMPLTTRRPDRDSEIRKAVWYYCVKNNLFYSARLHIHVWEEERKR